MGMTSPVARPAPSVSVFACTIVRTAVVVGFFLICYWGFSWIGRDQRRADFFTGGFCCLLFLRETFFFQPWLLIAFSLCGSPVSVAINEVCRDFWHMFLPVVGMFVAIPPKAVAYSICSIGMVVSFSAACSWRGFSAVQREWSLLLVLSNLQAMSMCSFFFAHGSLVLRSVYTSSPIRFCQVVTYSRPTPIMQYRSNCRHSCLVHSPAARRPAGVVDIYGLSMNTESGETNMSSKRTRLSWFKL